jgi:hypothetical protein
MEVKTYTQRQKPLPDYTQSGLFMYFEIVCQNSKRFFSFAFSSYSFTCSIRHTYFLIGAAVAQLVEALRYKPEGRRVRFPMVSLECFIDIILSVALWPWGRPSLSQKWVPGIFPGGVNAAGAYGWQPYHLQVPIVWKSGSLSLLEPSGTVQACNGTALPYLFS